MMFDSYAFDCKKFFFSINTHLLSILSDPIISYSLSNFNKWRKRFKYLEINLKKLMLLILNIKERHASWLYNLKKYYDKPKSFYY